MKIRSLALFYLGVDHSSVTRSDLAAGSKITPKHVVFYNTIYELLVTLVQA